MRLGLELALTFAPFAILVGLLLRGCFPGERAIIAHRLRNAARRLRAPKMRWRRSATPKVSALARTVPALRGPPVAA